MRHINFFLGAQNRGFWVGAEKFRLKKFMFFFFFFLSLSVGPVLRLRNRSVFLDLVRLGNHCGQWIAKSMGLPYRSVWTFNSAMSVEEWPNRNRFGIHSEIFSCVMAFRLMALCPSWIAAQNRKSHKKFSVNFPGRPLGWVPGFFNVRAYPNIEKIRGPTRSGGCFSILANSLEMIYVYGFLSLPSCLDFTLG